MRKFPENGYVYWVPDSAADPRSGYWCFTTDPDECIDAQADAVFRYRRDAQVIIKRETSVIEKH